MVDRPPDPVDPERRVSDEAERARALAEVLRDQEERAEAARHLDERRQKFARVRRTALVAAWVGVAYVWLGSPAWLRVEPPEPQTVMEEAGSLRRTIFFQSQKIEAYRQARGRLPFVLEEAGPPFRGVEYRRKDGRYYELRGASDRVNLRYESERPAFDFVGRALEELEASLGDSERGEG